MHTPPNALGGLGPGVVCELSICMVCHLKRFVSTRSFCGFHLSQKQMALPGDVFSGSRRSPKCIPQPSGRGKLVPSGVVCELSTYVVLIDEGIVSSWYICGSDMALKQMVLFSVALDALQNAYPTERPGNTRLVPSGDFNELRNRMHLHTRQ